MNAAISSAVIDLLGTVGYAHLTMESVAVQAVVHRATLYRRWPNKEALVVDMLLAHAERVIPSPDTGSVETDLQLLVASVVRNLQNDGEIILRSLVGEASRVPELRGATNRMWEYRLGLAASLVRRGIDRGELPSELDADEFIEEMIAPIFFRFLGTGRAVDEEFARSRVTGALARARIPQEHTLRETETVEAKRNDRAASP